MTTVEKLELSLLGIISFDSEELRARYKKAIEKAKEMEKEQIIDALKEGVNFEIDNSHSTQINYKKHFEKYYNETFKSEQDNEQI
jgi:hypothetical protein